MEIPEFKMKISVIIPCYNCADTIERAVSSVRSQTLEPFEIIMIDDASGDETKKVLGGLNCKVITLKKNEGAGVARNYGLNIARGDLIAFLDSDDVWHPEKLAIQGKFMIDNPDIEISGHDHFVMKNGWIALKKGHKNVSKIAALLSNPFATPSVMMRNKKDYRFSKDKRFSEDYLLWLEIILRAGAAVKLNAALAASFKADYGAGGLSSNLWQMEKGELNTYKVLREKKLIGLFSWIFLSAFSFLKYLKRVATCRLFCSKVFAFLERKEERK